MSNEKIMVHLMVRCVLWSEKYGIWNKGSDEMRGEWGYRYGVGNHPTVIRVHPTEVEK